LRGSCDEFLNAIFCFRNFDWKEEIASVPSPNDSYDVVVRKVGGSEVKANWMKHEII